MATFDQVISRLNTFAAAAQAVERRRLETLIYQLTQHAKTISHYRSGLMRQTLHPMGPVTMGAGVLEAWVEPGVSYAEHEVKRGGSHDYAARTIQETTGLRAAWTRDLEYALVLALFEASL